MKSNSLRLSLSASTTKNDLDPLVYDFSLVDAEYTEEFISPWEQYQKLCHSQSPPVPALSLMKPILAGDELMANFPHQRIGPNLPLILEMLAKMKVVNELNLRDNSLQPSCVDSLIEFIKEDESLSVVDISDNPMIGPKAMARLLEGIKECQNLEQLNITHTGCNKMVGPAIAQMLAGCRSLVKLWIGNCDLKTSATEIMQAVAEHSKIRKLVLSRNQLHMGGRRFGLQLGTNVGKCESLRKLKLTANALSSEMVQAMLKGLAQAPELRKLDLSQNNIDEVAGRSIAIFITKAPQLRKLYLDQNPLLNVTINKIAGQKKMEEDAKKPGAKKSKTQKQYIPGCYSILTGISKSPSMRICRMIGLVVDQFEWEEKLAALKTAKPDCEIIYQTPSEATYRFHAERPQTAVPAAPAPQSARRNKPGSR